MFGLYKCFIYEETLSQAVNYQITAGDSILPEEETEGGKILGEFLMLV